MWNTPTDHNYLVMYVNVLLIKGAVYWNYFHAKPFKLNSLFYIMEFDKRYKLINVRTATMTEQSQYSVQDKLVLNTHIYQILIIG